ncbi:uncharacterized protein LOC110038236 [Phalaenopsis equestris]|uniref:uncharacterized protein LOC110038236 n=1 Tax=Phalaenopsis equestris TaxID=78828 RepID=UPI0009E60B06|nr:uncharacterized protein LOC110038236 [Phalaenopsis equestris]
MISKMRGFMLLSMKIVGASAAVLTSAVALWFATPPVTEFLADEGPLLYKSIAAWLTPPYLYFIINGIIISIAATSRFQKTVAVVGHPTVGATLYAPSSSISVQPDQPAQVDYISKFTEDTNLLPDFLAPAVGLSKVTSLSDSVAETELEEEFVISRSSCSPKRRGSSENLQKKSASGAGGGAASRSIKASTEGKALGVARPRKHETLENTWRTITDGRPVPLARHLKKADTWDNHSRAITAVPLQPAPPVMRKAEGIAVPPGGALSPVRREPSLGQDDLNRRVEAFIKKFNEEMRLQRQGSLQQVFDSSLWI